MTSVARVFANTLQTVSAWDRYVEGQRRRSLAAFTNPWLMGASVVVLWLFFRWWPAILMSAWLALCVGLAIRQKRQIQRR